MKKLLYASITATIFLVIGACSEATETEASKTQEEIDKETEELIAKLEAEQNQKEEQQTNDAEEDEKSDSKETNDNEDTQDELEKEDEEQFPAITDSESQFTEADIKMLNESYEWVKEEYSDVIVSIFPIDEESYDPIYVVVPNEVKLLDDNEKQYIVDEIGASVVNMTIVNLYGGDHDNTINVFFKYEDENALADPEIFGDGWVIK